MNDPDQPDFRESAPGIPPWLWIVLIIFLFSTLPTAVTWFGYVIDALAWTLIGNSENGLLFFSAALGMSGVLIEILGIITVLFPRMRQRWVEREYDLAPGPYNLASLSEIEAYVRKYAPHLTIMAAPVRPFLAFVYPTGYRTARIGIGGGLLKLWRTNRPVAETVLLHEISHYRRGDMLIVGTGSLLQAGLKWVLRITAAGLVIFLALNILMFMSQAIMYSRGYIGVMLPVNMLILVGVGFLSSLASLFQTITNLLLWLLAVILAFWAIEINADWLALHLHGGSPHQLQMGLLILKSYSADRIFMNSLTHPPTWMRLWFLKHADYSGYILLLALFPLGYLIYLPISGVFWGLDLTINFLNGGPVERSTLMMMDTIYKIINYLTVLVPIYAGLIIFWPFFTRAWERFISHSESHGPIGVVWNRRLGLHGIASFILIGTTIFGRIGLSIPLILEIQHPSLAMAVSLGDYVPRKLTFQGTHITITPHVAYSNYDRLEALAMLPQNGDGSPVLLLFRDSTMQPLQLAGVRQPMSAALLDKQGVIVDILKIPQSDLIQSRVPVGSYRFALLMPQGWFQNNGIRMGKQISIAGWPPPINCINYFWSTHC